MQHKPQLKAEVRPERNLKIVVRRVVEEYLVSDIQPQS